MSVARRIRWGACVALIAAVVSGMGFAFTPNSDTPPIIPVAQDAYRMWDKWPYQRIGARAYMRSTYDRTGHNSDASNYLYQEADNFNVTLDVEGPGVLYFVRTNHWHGSPWHYEIDGKAHMVQETTTANPVRKIKGAVFMPEALFPSPLTFTYDVTKGADLNWVPMPFEDRLRLAYSRTFYGTGYYIFHKFAPGAPLSKPIEAWDGKTPPDPAVLRLLSSVGTDIAPKTGAGLKEYSGTVQLPSGQTLKLADLAGAPATLRKLSFSVPQDRAVDFGHTRLRIAWDGRNQPSVDAPIDLFFGAGTLYNNDGREWLVKAMPVTIRFAEGRAFLDCYFPMPFFRSANIELLGAHDGKPITDIKWSARTLPYNDPWNHVGYFHATYKNHGTPQLGQDLVFLDTEGVEGAQEWSGSFVGTSFIFTDNNVLTTLEGDPRFFFDDSETPHAQGTGTEEWGGGGDYWGGLNMTLPFAGHPVGIVNKNAAKDPKELIHSAYRYLLADLMPFGKRALIRFDHGGENESIERYHSVSYWYGLPSPSLVLTDTLDVGDFGSEQTHAYQSPQSVAYAVTSRYEWGPDHVPVAFAHPVGEPDQYVDYEFEAKAGKYRVWLETKVSMDFFEGGSAWLQFNEDIGTDKLNPAYMGAWGFLSFGSPEGQYQFGNGSLIEGDNDLSSLMPPSVVTFGKSGKQRLRIQPRSGRIQIGRVLLSPDRRSKPKIDFAPAAGEILLAAQKASEGFQLVDDMAASGGKAFALDRDPTAHEMQPARTLNGRRTEGASEFTVKIRSDNHGVMLRRTLDYEYANQRAKVSVQTDKGWEDAGVWYLAGSNTYYRSWPLVEGADGIMALLSPAGELGAARPVVITSNRRLRDDEFLLPVHLTRGKDQIRVRVEFAPRNPPLLPRRPAQATAWTELTYKAYSYVMPRVELP